MTRRGASLLELTLVVLLMGILAGVAAPRYQLALAEHRAESASRRLAADLRAARGEALGSSGRRAVTLLLGRDGYAIATAEAVYAAAEEAGVQAADVDVSVLRELAAVEQARAAEADAAGGEYTPRLTRAGVVSSDAEGYPATLDRGGVQGAVRAVYDNAGQAVLAVVEFDAGADGQEAGKHPQHGAPIAIELAFDHWGGTGLQQEVALRPASAGRATTEIAISPQGIIAVSGVAQ